jgi:hypothetical protein
MHRKIDVGFSPCGVFFRTYLAPEGRLLSLSSGEMLEAP